MISAEEKYRATPALRTIGFWLAVPMAALQGLNVGRVLLDPVGFAAYIGVPLENPADIAWVQVYGLRTAFITLLATFFLIRRDLNALKWMALAAVVMPLGDALIANQSGASASTVVRHLMIAGYLVVTVIALWWSTRNRRAVP
jgi:hypothetical protein